MNSIILLLLTFCMIYHMYCLYCKLYQLENVSQLEHVEHYKNRKDYKLSYTDFLTFLYLGSTTSSAKKDTQFLISKYGNKKHPFFTKLRRTSEQIKPIFSDQLYKKRMIQNLFHTGILHSIPT